MGPKSKKPLKNAFSFFLDDYVKSEREKGRQVSHRVAAEECAPQWQSLSEEEKRKYNDLATHFKAHYRQDKQNKFTSTGISYAQLEKEQEELRLKIEREDEEIKMTISNLDSELLKTHLFYIIHCNYYCMTDAGTYVPGELAIAEFNLGEGVRETYHTLINPGHVPLGYAFEAKRMIDEVHGLPYPPYDEGDSDYFGILDRVCRFLEPGKLPDGRYPPLYCLENNAKVCENVLQRLSDNNSEAGSFFRVFLLHKMFFWLKNKCVEFLDDESVGFPVMYNAESEINKDLFCFSPGISCFFHMTSEEKFQNCSLSIVQRQVYTICDHCCQYVDVELVPGKHCRLKGAIKKKAGILERRERIRRCSPSVSEDESEAQSSFAGELGFDWKQEQRFSFLHDEIESKFGALDASSIASTSSHFFSTPGPRTSSSVRTKPVHGEEAARGEEEAEDEDFRETLSLGRGAKRL